MTDGVAATKKAKKPRKLVPIVNTRHRRTVKKETPTKPPTEQKSASFQELVEAAHTEAKWQRGSARPRQRHPNAQSTVAFGGVTGAAGKLADAHRGAWSAERWIGEIKKEDKPEPVEDPFPDDPFRPITIPIRPSDPADGQEDAEKLLPQYLEQKLLEMDSDDQETAAAHDLELLDATESDAMLFQLPSDLPVVRSKAEEKSEALESNVLPEGRIGKMEIYRSGKVRLRMGNVELDVGSGTPWPFHQQLVAINVRDEDGHCVFLGDVKKRALCTVNVSQLFQCEEGATTEGPPAWRQKREEKIEKSCHVEMDVDPEGSEDADVMMAVGPVEGAGGAVESAVDGVGIESCVKLKNLEERGDGDG